MLKLFLFAAGFTLPLIAQSDNWHGIRVGQVQAVPFLEPPSQPQFVADPPPPSRVSVLRAEFETWVEGIPKSYLESVSGGFSESVRDGGKLVIRRFVRDNIRDVFTRYSVIVERREPGIFRVSFEESSAKVPGVAAASWRESLLGVYPVPQIVREGENVAITVMADPGGRRVMDYVRIGLRQMTPRNDSARDVYADDSGFEITEPRLKINGLSARLTVPAQPVKGSRLRFDVPGYGRYILTFRPLDATFTRVGETSGTTLTFMIGGNVFHVDSMARIPEAGSGTYSLYGFRDPTWESTDPNAPAQISASTPVVASDRR